MVSKNKALFDKKRGEISQNSHPRHIDEIKGHTKIKTMKSGNELNSPTVTEFRVKLKIK